MAWSSSSPSGKMLKTDESEIEEDRISSLPDSVIIDQILTRLSDTKLAITTGILSKRWQYLWQSVPCLRFDDFSSCKSATNASGDFDFHHKAFIEFYNGVHNTLSQFQLHSINKFELDANYDSEFILYVQDWIEFAVSKNVKKFKMYLRNVGDEDEFLIESEAFFKNSHFTHIDLGFCLLHPTVCIRWNNLVNLCLSHSRLDEELISNIVSGSPLLNTLTFQSCYGSLIDIRSNSVKDLVLVGYEAEEHGNSVMINAPNISSLTVIGDLSISSILLRDVSSLVKAELNYEIPYYYGRLRKQEEEDVLNGFILKLQHVKEFKIGVCCFPTLCRLEAKGFTFPSNLIGVDVTSIYYNDSDVESSDVESDVESSDVESDDVAVEGAG